MPGPNCTNCGEVVDQQSFKCPCNLLKQDLWTGYFIQSYKEEKVTHSDSESEDLENILESDSDDAAYFSDADQSEENNRESVLQSNSGMSPDMLELNPTMGEVNVAIHSSPDYYYEDSGEESPVQCEEIWNIQAENSPSESQLEDPEGWIMLKNIVALYEGFTAYGKDESIFVRPRPHFYHFEKNYPLPTNSTLLPISQAVLVKVLL